MALRYRIGRCPLPTCTCRSFVAGEADRLIDKAEALSNGRKRGFSTLTSMTLSFISRCSTRWALTGALCVLVCPSLQLHAQQAAAEPESQRYPGPLKLGSLVFSFSPERGFVLNDHGIPIIDGSNLRVVNSAWKRIYFNLAETSPTVTVADTDGGKALTISNIPPTGEGAAANTNFVYTLHITVSPSQPSPPSELVNGNLVSFRLSYRASQQLNAKVEFAMGFLNANPIKGRKYASVLAANKPGGFLPVAPSLHNTRVPPFESKFSRLWINTRLGDWHFTATGDYPVLTLLDSRGQHWAVESGKSVFWFGVPGAELPTGKEVTVGAEFRFSSSAPAQISPLPPLALPAAISQSEISNARVPTEKPLLLVPTPQHFEARKQDFIFTDDTVIYLPPRPTERDTLIADLLRQELEQVYGIRIRALPWDGSVPPSGTRMPKNCIILGETNIHPGSDLICRREKIEVSPQNPGPEGYVISVTENYVLVCGSDRAGTFYGTQTLLQMITPREDGMVIVTGGLIHDSPDFEFRGVHLLADDDAGTWIGELITKVLSKHKINNIVLECEYAKWDSHPEIHQPWGMTKEEMRQLKELAEKYFIRITPLVQSLGHCEWMFANGQNLDLVEEPDQVYSYCPSNPNSYAFLFDIFQEAIDVFQPEYLHIGHDEITRKGQFGKCKRCAGRPASLLFSENVRLLQQYLDARKVRTMMWGDMLLAPSEAQDAAHGGLPYDTYQSRPAISRDITICDWHYNPYRDYPSARMFVREGFPVIGATWHNRRNIFYFSKSAKQADALGMLQTTWTGYRGNRTALQRQVNQISAYIVAADYFWSSGNPPIEQFTYRPSQVLQESLSRKPAVRTAQAGFIVDLNPITNIELMDTGRAGSWLGYGLRFDLRRMPVGMTRLGSLLFDIPSRRRGIAASAAMLRGTYTEPQQFPDNIAIPVGRKANALAFLHTCGWRVADGTKIGEIQITFSGGNTQTIDIVYGENIYAWDDEVHSNADGAAVWHGATVAGTPVSVSAFVWENPTPDQVIDTVSVRSTDTEASPTVIALTGLTTVTNGQTGAHVSHQETDTAPRGQLTRAVEG